MENKFFLKSKTVIFNLVMVILLVISENSELVKNIIANDITYSWLMLIVTIINIYLRTVTNTPVRLK